MKSIALALGLLCTLTLAGPAKADIVPPMTSPEISARETAQAFFENFNAASADGIASTFADRPDFIWVENGRVAFDTRTTAVEGMRSVLSSGQSLRMEVASTEKVIVLNSTAAEVVSPFTMYVGDGAGKEVPVITGVITLAIVEGPDGVWRIAAGHTSSAAAAQ